MKRELKLIKNSIKKVLVASRIRAVAALAFALIVSTALVAHAEDVVVVVQVGPTTNDVTTAQMPFTPMGAKISKLAVALLGKFLIEYCTKH